MRRLATQKHGTFHCLKEFRIQPLWCGRARPKEFSQKSLQRVSVQGRKALDSTFPTSPKQIETIMKIASHSPTNRSATPALARVFALLFLSHRAQLLSRQSMVAMVETAH